MVYDTRYISSNKACAVANNAVYTLDLTSDKPKVTEYNSRTLQHMILMQIQMFFQ